ncbi:MAG: DUF1080 domain-containing protein [Cyclobacteriaceae bacterium]
MQRLRPSTQMKYLLAVGIYLWSMQVTVAQTTTLIKDLSAFKDPGKSWKMVGSVTADLNNPNVLNISSGLGILINLPDKKNHGADLFTRDEYGDIVLELDYMMAKGSNSGIYFQGRYEVQLMDSWTLKTPTPGSNGGIYERWDDARQEGQKGYEGYPPRHNASRAPGLWQHLEISFQAPRFDATGRKTDPAKMLRVELNGVLIHEEVELSGPTRGGIGPENSRGPLRFQGDHGAVALRNIKITQVVQSNSEKTETNRRNQVYPILVNASDHRIFRSFMDLPGGVRVVHAVSVSSEENAHYTYDTDTGMIIQVWRGNFLDATPMWHSRGDGSSRPLGAVQTFGTPALALAKLSSTDSPWKADTTGTGFHPKGYVLDDNGDPQFHYRIYGSLVKDATQALKSGEGVSREISISGPTKGFYVRLAEGASIVNLEKSVYLVEDNSYYLRVDDASGGQPIIRNANGRKELIVPIAGTLKYTILF